jgi:hypothetical protein
MRGSSHVTVLCEDAPMKATRASFVAVRESALGRLCCKSLKTPGDKFPARSRNKPRSLIDVASGSLPKSPVSLSLAMRSPTCLLESRVYSSKILRSTVQKVFYTQSARRRHRLIGAVQVIRVQCKRRSRGGGYRHRPCVQAVSDGECVQDQVRPSPTDTLGKRESLREHRDINSTEAGRLSLAVMPKTTRYKHKEGRHLCTRIPR